jgi:glycosyltransferase involved in cell wall biosynthesis
MKILFTLAHIGKGGGQQTQAVNLVNEISKEHDCQLVTLHYDSDIIVPPPNTIYAGDLRFPQGIFNIHRHIKKHKDEFDLIQVLDPYYALPAAWLSRKRPYILRIGMDPILDLKVRKKKISAVFGRMMLPRMLKSSAAVTVNSRHFLQQYSPYNPIYIPNGYDFQTLSTHKSKEECRKRFGFPEDNFLLLFTGKIIPRKTLEIVLDSLNEVEDATFIVVGNTNEPLYGERYYKELRTKYKNIMDKVIFTGEKKASEIKYILKACDAYVFPSRLEGSPNALLEAMGAGLPAICSDIPPHSEIIEQGRNGMLFRDRNELVQCIIKLKNDKKILKKFGEEGQKYVVKNHSIKNVANMYITAYHNVLEDI